MKTMVKTQGLQSLVGQNVTLFCVNYIYAGKLVNVSPTCVLLENASVVYETGDFSSKTFKDAQKLPNSWFVQTSAIESFGILK